MFFSRLALFWLVAGISFAAEPGVPGLLEQRCSACHSAETRSSGFSIATRHDLLSGGSRRGAAVLPGHPENSPLVQMLRGTITPRMPLGGEPLAESEIRSIESWISEMQPSETAVSSDAKWAFSRPEAGPAPSVTNESWGRNWIDLFVLNRLESEGLTPAPEASKRELLRRLYFDLIGLPPTALETRAFLEDDSAEAYERLVDKLLADPRYGERWGRHWLDLARYADSTGGEANREMYSMWRYRDYVIDAFNKDKPYDRFIVEQLAGDESPGKGPDKLIATGFLRLGSPPQSQIRRVARQQLLDELTRTVSSVFLGLTVGCAQCHDHKYDPIPTKDFYRLEAFFLPLEYKTADAPFEDSALSKSIEHGRLAAEERLASARRNYEDYEQQLIAKLRTIQSREGKEASEATPAALRSRLTDAIANGVVPSKDPNFTLDEKNEYLRLLTFVDGFRGGRDMGVYRRQVERHLPKVHTVGNASESSSGAGLPVQFVRIRGDVDSLGEMVRPGFLSAVTGGSDDVELPTDELGNVNRWRLPLAKWIASPDNPLTARVMVNRIWQHHFGRGIVATPSDFGANGARPTHLDLLDRLAVEFVKSGWSVKQMHRLMLTSATYRQSSAQILGKALEVDPDNRLLSHMSRRRIEGEVIRDSILAVSGRLNPEPGGPGVYPRLPEAMKDQMFVKNWPAWEPSDGPDSRRRSIYVFQRRQLALPLLEMMDAPVPQVSADLRSVSTTALQSLTMLNGRLVAEESAHFAARLAAEAGPDAKAQIRRAFELALARAPSDEELARYDDFARSGADDVMTSICRVLLNSNEFVYVD